MRKNFLLIVLIISIVLLGGLFAVWAYSQTRGQARILSVQCPARYGSVTMKSSGFLITSQLYAGDPPTDEFVLPPASTGTLTFTYDSTGYGKISDLIPSNESAMSFFSIEDVYLINSSGGLSYQAMNQSTLSITVSNISVSNYTATVTYTIEASPSASNNVSYDATFWQTCPGELITVGTQLYGGQLPWVTSLSVRYVSLLKVYEILKS